MDAKTQEMIDALRLFKQAHSKIIDLWYDGVDLNDTESLIHYPFDRSFDELSIPEWVNNTVNELEAKAKVEEFDGSTMSVKRLVDCPNKECGTEFEVDVEIYDLHGELDTEHSLTECPNCCCPTAIVAKIKLDVEAEVSE
jgi:hypothetical protein